MFPECREGWPDGSWTVRLEGRERNVPLGRTECRGPWFTQIRTGLFPPGSQETMVDGKQGDV